MKTYKTYQLTIRRYNNSPIVESQEFETDDQALVWAQGVIDQKKSLKISIGFADLDKMERIANFNANL